MVNAQEWLDKDYPINKRNKETKIYAQNRNLEDELVVEGWKKLENLQCRNNERLKGIKLVDLPKLNFVELNFCQLTDITIKNCPKIEFLSIGGNLLSKTDLLADLEPENLTYLSIHSNNFESQGLEFLGNFVNLKNLYIGNSYKGKFEEGTYNRFSGSLKPLKDLKNLKWLSISHTDIDSGLEYLPDGFRKISCKNNWRENAGCSKIKNDLVEAANFPGVTEELEKVEKGEEELGPYTKNDYYRVAPWRQMGILLLKEKEKVLEINKKEKIELLRKVFAQEEDLFELEEKIETKNREIETVSEEIKGLEKKFVAIRGEVLRKKVKERKEELEKEKKDWDGRIERLLQSQEEIVRCNSTLAVEIKNELLEELSISHSKRNSDELKSKLSNLCEEQTEITKSEIQLEDFEKTIWLTNVSRSKSEKNIELVPNIPNRLLKEIKNKKIDGRTEDWRVKASDYDYDEVKLVSHPFSWESNEEKQLSPELLPLRLYNIETSNLEETQGLVGQYSILSYAWGEKQEGENLSQGGKEALARAIRTLEILKKEYKLDTNYLWMDQLCINQNSTEEKNQEVRKMGQYYSKSLVTLIPINAKVVYKKGNNESFSLPYVLSLVIRSKWFERSWTFQEGWLSKQTIFMFDDALVDGRTVAATWVFCQPSYTEYTKFSNLKEFNKGLIKIATPIGWVYCKETDSSDKVELRLHEALRIIKERKSTLPIDNIYSILGLLPYGEKVEVSYSISPKQALEVVMKTAVQNGYGEPLAWHGPSNDSLEFCWLPETDENGSTKVEGGIDVDCVPDGIEFMSNNAIKMKGFEYEVHDICYRPITLEKGEGFLVDSDIHMSKIMIKVKRNGGKLKSNVLTLLGTLKTLGKVKKEVEDEKCFLVTFNKDELKSSDRLFSMLVSKSKENDAYCRIGLVELFLSEAEKLEGGERKEIVIGMSNQERTSQQDSYIEIPPKGKR